MAEKSVAKRLAVFLKLEQEYMKFREAVGKIAMEVGENPYDLLISHLEASLADEKNRRKKAAEKVDEVAAKVAETLGCSLDDLKNGKRIEISPEQMEDIIELLDEDDDDDDEED